MYLSPGKAANMRARFVMRALLVAAALAGSVMLVPGLASAATGNALIDVTVPGPVSGSQTCISLVPGCIEVQGVANFHVVASVNLTSPAVPLITPAHAPGCTASVHVGVTITPGLASGSVIVLVEFDRTDPNGNAIPGSHTTIRESMPFVAGGPPVTVTECAAVK
jgi:hypothetical protein